MFSDDPQRQAMMMLAAGLLSPVKRKGGAGFAEALSQGIQGGLLGFNQGSQNQRRNQMADMENKFKQAQLGRYEQEQNAQNYMGEGIKKFMQPGTPSVPFNDSLGDGTQGTIPGQSPSFDRQGFAGYLAQNPQTAPKALDFMPKPKEPKWTVAPNGELVDLNNPNTAKNYAKPEKAPDWQNPDWIATQLKLRKAGAPSVSVNTGKQENAFSTEYGKTLAESYGNLMKSDVAAASTINKLDRMESLLKSAGKTGPLTPTLVSIKAVAKQMGITNPEVLDETDFAKASSALSNEMALELRNPAGGAGMPGALSDKDREFLVGMVAGPDKLPNANAMIIEGRRRLAKRERDVARLARDYRKRNGKFDEGFYNELAAFADANPLFADMQLPSAPAQSGQSRVVDFNSLP